MTLTQAQRQVLATVALSHPDGCDCDAACRLLRLDAERRAQLEREYRRHQGDLL